MMSKMRSIGGFSFIEALLALVLTSIVLGVTTYFLLAENSSYKGQKERLSINDNLRATMDFVTRMMKGATVTPGINITGTNCSNTVAFSYAESFGISTGGNTSNTLNDTGQAWTTDQWSGYQVVITGGGGSSQTRTITSNTTNQLVLSADWTTIPDTTSVYKIVSSQQFSMAGTTLRYQNISKATGVETLADRITCFSVQQDGTYPAQYNIIMTSQTGGSLPDTGRIGSATLRASVEVRN